MAVAGPSGVVAGALSRAAEQISANRSEHLPTPFKCRTRAAEFARFLNRLAPGAQGSFGAVQTMRPAGLHFAVFSAFARLSARASWPVSYSVSGHAVVRWGPRRAYTQILDESRRCPRRAREAA